MSANPAGCFPPPVRVQDVLVTLLNNLKVQERQNRVCTTVAIAIVAETCAPFTGELRHRGLCRNGWDVYLARWQVW